MFDFFKSMFGGFGESPSSPPPTPKTPKSQFGGFFRARSFLKHLGATS